MKDRKKPEKFWLPHGMPSDDRAFAFSSRVFPKASQIKTLYKLWHYQSKSVSGSVKGNCMGRFSCPREGKIFTSMQYALIFYDVHPILALMGHGVPPNSMTG